MGLNNDVIGYGTAVAAEEIGNNDNGFDFNRCVTIAPVTLMFRLLNGIIGFHFDLFAVTTAITTCTYDNQSEREEFDCECVFEFLKTKILLLQRKSVQGMA